MTGGYRRSSLRAGDGRSLLLDGELVALDRNGRPDFGLLQQRMHVRAPSVELAPGASVAVRVRRAPGRRPASPPRALDARRERLVGLGLDGLPRVAVPPSPTCPARSCSRWPGHTPEGWSPSAVVPLRPGRRSAAWVKTALLTTREVILWGRTPGEGRRPPPSARCCSVRTTEGRLRYAGRHRIHRAMLRDLLCPSNPAPGRQPVRERCRASTPAGSVGWGRGWSARSVPDAHLGRPAPTRRVARAASDRDPTRCNRRVRMISRVARGTRPAAGARGAGR